VVTDNSDLRGVIRMGSQVRYCDDTTGDVRDVVLVHPHEADITLRRISVLTPVGAALIGPSVGQGIEFQNPAPQQAVLDDTKRVQLKGGLMWVTFQLSRLH
jgi:regulator of nucleoside diphosphate kinase